MSDFVPRQYEEHILTTSGCVFHARSRMAVSRTSESSGSSLTAPNLRNVASMRIHSARKGWSHGRIYPDVAWGMCMRSALDVDDSTADGAYIPVRDPWLCIDEL